MYILRFITLFWGSEKEGFPNKNSSGQEDSRMAHLQSQQFSNFQLYASRLALMVF